MGLATLLSVFAPMGEARLADPAPGLTFDWPVAILGAVAAVVLALGVPSALRGARTRRSPRQARVVRPSAVGGAAAAAGAPAAAVLGIRQALKRGRGTARSRQGPRGLARSWRWPRCARPPYSAPACSTSPPRPSSTETPSRRSQLVEAGESGRYRPAHRAGTRSGDRPHHADLRARDHRQPRRRPGTRRRGAARPAAAIGRRRPASGWPWRDSPRRLHHAPGPRAHRIRGPGGRDLPGTAPLAAHASGWWGWASFPSDFGTGGLGTGAALTTAGYTAAQCPPSPAQPKCRRAAAAHPPDLVLVHAMPGPAGSAALARHIRQYAGDASRPTVPTPLVNFGESANFPLLLVGVVTLCGAATLAHLLAVSVWRRRRDSSLLKALGFVRRQVAAVVFWQAAAVTVAGIVVGVPLGLVAGRVVWRVFALDAGVVGPGAARL